MRLEIKPIDRLHMLVWKCDGGDWRAALGLNGCVIEASASFPTWDEALRYACWRAGL